MNNKLNTIQSLRGIACLAVVLFHYRFYLRGDEVGVTIWDHIFGWGAIGVDVFFVISGFIMVYTTHHYKTGLKSSKKFLINRATRILPIYYIGLLIAFLLGGAMSTFHYQDKTQNLISALTFSVYRTDITPHYIDDSGMYNIRWTLNYEIYFYFIFALCFIVQHRLIALFCWGGLATYVIPVSLGFTPTLSTHGYEFKSALNGFLSNPLLLEFLIGSAAGYIHIILKKKAPPVFLKKTSMVFSAFLFIYISHGIYSGTVTAVQIESTLLIGVLILSLSLCDETVSKILPNSLIQLGNLSFSLYLLHVSIGNLIFSKLGPANSIILSGIPSVAIALLASITASHFTHRYIEIKLSYWLKTKITNKINQAEQAS